jgi:hypothetical protein
MQINAEKYFIFSQPRKLRSAFIFPNHASYDRLPKLGNNRNAQFDVFRMLSRAIGT